MANFLMIGICLAAGFIFRSYDIVPKNAHKSINT